MNGWDAIAELLDERWFPRPDDHVRRARLVARHEAHGRSPVEARSWVEEVDQPNAELVLHRSIRATWDLDPG